MFDIFIHEGLALIISIETKCHNIGDKWKIEYKYNCIIGLMGRVFANGLGDRGSIPGRVIPKT